ncbi:MAG: hypothetical protein DI533_16045 [Cereibacter sphaeroides]|uniref:HTH lysR-type domain-containing protein n=1 Tax=Cereibacter sphaeroides TaxID=1063 RepID=A0A2W5S5K3_CERSP|nr:MAG: hypothetical protein DI533_16045 [Cereibacter sphaeroides]
MRLEWLEDILAVAETGSFGEAAERRHLTQSAFSRRMRNIEDYMGVELFDRSRKPIQLRPTTEDQRDRITRLSSELRQLVTDLRRADRRSSNRIVIASQHALTATLTPAILDGILGGGAEIFMRLRSANLDGCFALLLSRQADIAIVYRLPGEQHPISAGYIETALIGVDRLLPVYAMAKVSELNERFALGRLPYIAYPSDVFLGQVMERKIAPRLHRITDPVPNAETALTLAALEMAVAGVAVAWVPETLARPGIEAGRLADLSETLPHVELEITAVRLVGAAGQVEDRAWAHLLSMHS